MDEAKIRLSPLEKELVSNAGWILTKNGILEKVMQLFGRIQVSYREELKRFPGLPDEIVERGPKISRGEKYEGLPYLVLDYPRLFLPAQVFAIRTFFWWGNFFSITLHLAGDYAANARERISDAYPMLSEKGYSVCIGADPWIHHFGQDHYRRVSEMDHEAFTRLIREMKFIKLAIKFELDRWDDCEAVFPECFRTLLDLAGN
ncbi:MAG: hypothetical protein ACO25B_06220 [Chitinophagaceae bacterium]